MPSILNATTTSGLVTSADNSGSLQLQTNNGTTAVTISTGQVVTLANALPIASGGTGATSAATALSNLGGLSGSSSQLVKAWVNFDGVGGTNILASYNVSSVTRNGTGDYTVNFTSALADSNYAIVAMAANSNFGQANAPSLKYGNGTQNGGTSPSLKSTTQVTFVVGIGNSTSYFDSYGISVAIFR